MTPEFKKYYEDEMRYLKESGTEFAKAYPDIGSFLIDGEDQDPYVERLLEGFAFVSARCRENMTGDFEKMSTHLMEILSPLHLRYTPSISFIECKNISNTTEFLPKGSLISNTSKHLGKKVVHFTTTSDIHVLPMNITDMSFENRGRELKLKFSIRPKAHAHDIKSTHIDLFLNGDSEIVWGLLYTLMQEVQSATLSSHSFNSEIALPKVHGLDESESLIPPNLGETSNAHLLREFFVYKEKFKIVRLTLPEAFLESHFRTFTITLKFKDMVDDKLQAHVTKSSFKLNIVPAINLFTTKTEPVNVTQTKHEYPVKPANDQNLLIHNITKVEGINKTTGEQQEYLAHDTYDASEYKTSYYTLTQRKDIYGKPCYYISVYSPFDESVSEQYLSIDAHLSHGEMARKNVLLHQLNYLRDRDLASRITVSNITKPSKPINAINPNAHIWSLLSSLQRSLTSLGSAETFKELLHHYAQLTHPANKQYIDTIVDVRSNPVSVPVNGTLFPCTALHVVFKDERIKEYSKDSLGILSLLGEIVYQYLSVNVAMNNLVQLTFEIVPVGISFEWKPQNP